jgi:hypothetical protein
MPPIPSDPNLSPHSIRAAADRAQLLAAAKAAYAGVAAVQVPEAVKRREDRRAERERQAHRRHYLGTPQGT